MGGAPREQVPHVQAAGPQGSGIPKATGDSPIVLRCGGLRGVEHGEVQSGTSAGKVPREVVAVAPVGREQGRRGAVMLAPELFACHAAAA